MSDEWYGEMRMVPRMRTRQRASHHAPGVATQRMAEYAARIDWPVETAFSRQYSAEFQAAFQEAMAAFTR